MDFASWFLIGFGAVTAVLLGSFVWIVRKDASGKSYGPDTAMGLGIATLDTHHSHGPLDSGGTGAGSAGGDGGSG